MCQSNNNPTIAQTAVKGHQWVYNVACETPSLGGVLYLAPTQICILHYVSMESIDKTFKIDIALNLDCD